MEGLAGIVAIEKEVQNKIEEERINASKWIEEAKKKADEDLLSAEEEIKRTFDERLLAIEKEIRLDASQVINEAIKWRNWANNLSEDELKKVLLGFIKKVIPERQ